MGLADRSGGAPTSKGDPWGAGDLAGVQPGLETGVASGSTSGATIAVEVVYGAGPGQIDRSVLQLSPGASVQEALAASGVLGRCGLVMAIPASGPERDEPVPATGATAVTVGVWGREVTLTMRLRDRDRVELYRPLLVDPKEARRLRYRQQGERGRRAAKGARREG
jgi:uncharacterized protein